MKITKRKLRALIREEMGHRSQQKGARIDFYPWSVEETNISIVRDVEKDGYWAYVEDKETGKTIRKLHPTEEEARHWARAKIEKQTRDDNALQK